MTVEQAIANLTAMSPTDRIQIIQRFWDGLADQTETAPNAALKNELDRPWVK